MELEEKHEEKWSWDKETISKAQGLFAACRRFDRLVALAVLHNGLEPLKPLVAKLQKRNQDIYEGYHMIDQVINDLRETKGNMDEEFHHWYEMACKMAKSVGLMPSEPRLAKCWSRYRNNVPSEDCESYYWRAIGVPAMDTLIANLHDRMADTKHTELFTLLPSVCLSSKCDLNATATSFQKAFGDDLSTNTASVFRSEMKRWVKFCNTEIEKASKESKDLQDSSIDMLKYADLDCFPNILVLLAIGCISPIGSTEAERAASGVRRLKTPYHAAIGDKRESGLNFLQLQHIKRWTLKKYRYYS